MELLPINLEINQKNVDIISNDSLIIRNGFGLRKETFWMIFLIKVKWKTVSKYCGINHNYTGMIAKWFKMNFNPPADSLRMKNWLKMMWMYLKQLPIDNRIIQKNVEIIINDSVIIRNEYQFNTYIFGMILLIRGECKTIWEYFGMKPNYTRMIANSLEIIPNLSANWHMIRTWLRMIYIRLESKSKSFGISSNLECKYFQPSCILKRNKRLSQNLEKWIKIMPER